MAHASARIHDVRRCYECGKTWDCYANPNGDKETQAHADKTGHEIEVEVGYVLKPGWPPELAFLNEKPSRKGGGAGGNSNA